MARKRESTNQPPLFERDVPKMPEGYYSAGPNPNLRGFVEEHATPYSAQTDEYNVPPFDEPIDTTKRTAIYNMHSYQGKKPHDAIRQYIGHYTRPGDVVLDPFCGSGSTALAAMAEDRVAVAIDLSPAATLITKHYCTPVDLDALNSAFQALSASVKPELDWLYQTRCDRCDGRATTDHMVYSHTYQCPRCLEKFPLFDCVEAQGETTTGKPKKIRACPYCYERGHVEEISTRKLERLDAVPVLVSYLCQEGCTPKRAERLHNDPNPKKRAFFQKYDIGKLRKINEREIPYWYPKDRMLNASKDQERWGALWRPYHGDIRRVDQFFTKRNLWAIAALFNAIDKLESDSPKHVFKLSLTGFLSALSKMQRYYPSSSFPNMALPNTYYVPPIFAEENVPKYFSNKVARNIKGLRVLNNILVSTDCVISTQSATDLGNVPSNSIDYIFTDPPYSDNVQYGELSFIWEAWLRLNTDWHEQEIIVNKTRGQTEDDWASSMRKAMTECYRVLKPGRWLSLCYHDTSEGTWQLAQDVMAEAGFISEQLDQTLYIDTEQKSYNQYTADKVTKRDLVINFRKPRPGELIAQLTLLGDEDEATFTEKARAILREALEEHPGSPADRLYDELVSRMVRKGEFERHDFNQLLHSVAEESPPESGRWYLLETADEVDEAESAKEAAAAARLEAFMHTHLEEHPAEPGVHYSDLFEQYLPLQDKPRRLLIDWLPEYFFKTPEGTWRPPADDEERAQKKALRTSGVLRRIKRFGRALMEGVPPHDRDRPANVATAADWMRECRRAGLYEFGRVLYEKGGFNFEELGDERLLEVEEDYQICVRRSD